MLRISVLIFVLGEADQVVRAPPIFFFFFKKKIYILIRWSPKINYFSSNCFIYNFASISKLFCVNHIKSTKQLLNMCSPYKVNISVSKWPYIIVNFNSRCLLIRIENITWCPFTPSKWPIVNNMMFPCQYVLGEIDTSIFLTCNDSDISGLPIKKTNYRIIITCGLTLSAYHIPDSS